MTVGVEGEADLRVPQALHDHAGMDSPGQEHGGVGVPEVMEPDAGELRAELTELHSIVRLEDEPDAPASEVA